jgi:hypothetical protein
MTTYQDSKGTVYKTRAEAKASNDVLGTSRAGRARNQLQAPNKQNTVSGNVTDQYSKENLDALGSARGDEFAPVFEAGGGVKSLKKGQSITDKLDYNAGQSGGGNATERANALASSQTAPSSALKSLSVSLAGGSPVATSNQTGVSGGKKKDYYSRYGNEDEPVVETPSYEEIQKQMMRDAQKQVNALHKYESDLLKEQQGINQQNDRSTQAVNVLSGLAGSSEANIQQQKTTAQGQQANKQIMDQVNTQVQSVLANVRKDAQQAYQYERTESRLDEATKQANRKEMYTKAQDNAKLLAQSGASADGYKATDPEGYQHLVKTLGSEELVKATFTLNRPVEQVVERKIEGGKLIQIYENPLTGKSTIETLDLGLPVGYSKTIDAGNRILAIPDNWDGDPSNLVTINKGLTPTQQVSGADEGGVNISDAAQNIIEQINLGASIDDLVKGTSNAAQKLRNEVLAGLNAQGGLSEKSFSVLEDGKDVVDAMLNSKAYKALGGYSSILGGQFSTSYGDAMAQASQLQAILARDNLGLLKGAMSDKDLAFIQAMSSGFEGQGVQSEGFIKERFESIQKSLAKKLENSPNTTGGSGVLTSPDGSQQVNMSDLTPAQVQEAKTAGWK